MFGKLIYFIKTLFKKHNVICANAPDQPIDPLYLISVDPIVDNETTIQNKIYGFFAHSRNRLFVRYNLTLTYDIWQGWNNQIRTKNENVVFVCKSKNDESEIWRVWFGHHVVFVAFKDDMIVTVLPITDRYKKLSQKNLRARASADIFAKTEVTSENIVKMSTILQKYKSPKLENYKNKYVRSF